jgi:O-acetylhomoserine/O-acetylserine sulfhydrylase-like pyridoxal-dependent enzyme
LQDNLIRLSPGIEHSDDLVEDLLEGLDALRAVSDSQTLASTCAG